MNKTRQKDSPKIGQVHKTERERPAHSIPVVMAMGTYKRITSSDETSIIGHGSLVVNQRYLLLPHSSSKRHCHTRRDELFSPSCE